MKHRTILTGILLLAALAVFAAVKLRGSLYGSRPADMNAVVEQALGNAVVRAKELYGRVEPLSDRLPRSAAAAGELETCDEYFWTSGYFPGFLWYIYDYSGDARVLEMAVEMSRRVENQKYYAGSHEIGLIIGCSFGNAWRVLRDSSYIAPVVTAARSLAARYNDKTHCIRSWSDPHSSRWLFPVGIESMASLELLCMASRLSGDECFLHLAVEHANAVMRNHFRSDFSSYHVVDYDPRTGRVVARNGYQGYSDSSAWSRGQAWGLYGFTMMYRETRIREYLDTACRIADFILRHPRLPEDGIPYWDFDDPTIPRALRDVSAGVILASALIELSAYADPDASAEYLRMAERQLRTLSSDEYTSRPGENGGFTLRHGVGSLPAGSEVDAPLSYADYYYVEALTRYRALLRAAP